MAWSKKLFKILNQSRIVSILFSVKVEMYACDFDNFHERIIVLSLCIWSLPSNLNIAIVLIGFSIDFIRGWDHGKLDTSIRVSSGGRVPCRHEKATELVKFSLSNGCVMEIDRRVYLASEHHGRKGMRKYHQLWTMLMPEDWPSRSKSRLYKTQSNSHSRWNSSQCYSFVSSNTFSKSVELLLCLAKL